MSKVLIVAEAGVNHQGRLDYALDLVHIAHNSGADAVKFQAFSAERQTDDSEKRAMLKGLALTESELMAVSKECAGVGIEFMCTAFDEQWLAYVMKLSVHRIKVSSGKVADKNFMRSVSATKMPVILSNGICKDIELIDALSLLHKNTVVLSCISEYPTPPEKIKLSEIARLRELTGHPVGFSSHTESFWPSVAAASLGASVVERHLTIDRAMVGPDHTSSSNPVEFAAMVREIRQISRG